MWAQVTPHNLLAGRLGSKLRTVGSTVHSGVLGLPEATEAGIEHWCEALATRPIVEVALIQPFDNSDHLIDAPARSAMLQWLRGLGIRSLGRFTPYACSGAEFHNDFYDFPNEAFCVAWVSDDAGWDLYFPLIKIRVPLVYGTVVLFDAAQPHGVVLRGQDEFDHEAFPFQTGTFISLDLRIDRKVRRVLGIENCSRHGRRGMMVAIDERSFRSEIDPVNGSWSVEDTPKKERIRSRPIPCRPAAATAP